MASRKDIYTQLESIEGGEAIKNALKELFQADDKKLQESDDALKALKGDTTSLNDQFEELKKAGESSVPKTEVEKQIADMQKSLDVLTTERDEAKQAAEQAATEKKNNDIRDFFSSAVVDGFGAKNAKRAVNDGLSDGHIKYTDSGEMSYKGKVGDEAIEAFIENNDHFEIDRTKEPFCITWNPKGYLKRVE